jgi:hypothetical protein
MAVFLDVKVIRGANGVISTDVYRKPTDRTRYLHPKSDHPNHVKSGIPKGQLRRLRRICKEDEAYEKRAKELKERMVSRGYQEKMIKKEVVQMRNMTREEALKKVEKGRKDKKINFVTTQSGYLPNVNKILKTNMHHLNIEELKECITEPPRLSLRRGRNLRDIVVDAKKKQGGGSGPCGRRCKLCEHMKQKKEVTDNDGRTYQINEKMDCGTIGAIYGMHC